MGLRCSLPRARHSRNRIAERQFERLRTSAPAVKIPPQIWVCAAASRACGFSISVAALPRSAISAPALNSGAAVGLCCSLPRRDRIAEVPVLAFPRLLLCWRFRHRYGFVLQPPRVRRAIWVCAAASRARGTPVIGLLQSDARLAVYKIASSRQTGAGTYWLDAAWDSDSFPKAPTRAPGWQPGSAPTSLLLPIARPRTASA